MSPRNARRFRTNANYSETSLEVILQQERSVIHYALENTDWQAKNWFHGMPIARVYFAFQAFGLAEVTRARALRAWSARRWWRKSRVDNLRLRRSGSSSQAQAKLVARRRNMPKTVIALSVRVRLRSSSRVQSSR